MNNKTIILENIKYSLELIETRIKNKLLTNDDESLLIDCISFRLIAIYEGLNEFNRATNNVLLRNYPQIKWEEFKKSIDDICNKYSSINYEIVLNAYEKYLLPLASIIDELMKGNFKMGLRKDEIINKLKELAPLYKEKGFEIVCINDNEEEYTSLIIYYKIDMKAIEKYSVSEDEWAVTKLMEFFDEIKSHLKIEINFKSNETLKSNDKVVFLDINKKFEIARKEFDKKRDMPYLYSLTKENKDRLRELEIFKNKVSFQLKNGWFDLVYNLGKDIEEVCKLANCELPQIDEIKSKYSSLRFDYYYKSDVKVPKIVEKLIDSLIYEAEDKSEYICEFCGSDNTEDEDVNGNLITKSCSRCKKAESEELNKEKKPFNFRKNRNNWYADELLERVAHIQEHANNKDIDVSEYLQMLDGVIKLINKIKEKVDEVEFVDFNVEDYTFNELYKYGNQKRFSKSLIIRKYLGTMNKQDIHTLCSKFGKDRVIKELNYEFKLLFELGFINIKGFTIAVTGDYREYGVFKEILEIVNSYE